MDRLPRGASWVAFWGMIILDGVDHLTSAEKVISQENTAPPALTGGVGYYRPTRKPIQWHVGIGAVMMPQLG
jgi:hypothetical protein